MDLISLSRITFNAPVSYKFKHPSRHPGEYLLIMVQDRSFEAEIVPSTQHVSVIVGVATAGRCIGLLGTFPMDRSDDFLILRNDACKWAGPLI